MVLRRLTTSLGVVSTSVRDQNWTAIAIEFVLVVLGVFLGVVAANWNEDRLERRETQKLLRQLDVELTAFVEYMESVDEYYKSAGRYADRATAGWLGDPSVDDEEFVIAAYQASQITGIGNNTIVWSTIFGAENLRDIDDLDLRQSVAAVMTFDYRLVDLDAVSSRYREEVRKIIPNDIQVAIRERCGDRAVGPTILVLPASCDLEIPPNKAAQVAAELRARPELVRELNWHRAAVANQLAQAEAIKRNARILTQRVTS
jgi:hypothetical protein